MKWKARYGWELGAEEGLDGVRKAFGLADGAFVLLFTLIIVTVSALVGGEFIDAVDSEGPFGDAIAEVESTAGTAFTLFGVGLLIIPAAAIVGYLWTQMGGLAGGFNRQGRM